MTKHDICQSMTSKDFEKELLEALKKIGDNMFLVQSTLAGIHSAIIRLTEIVDSK